LKLSVESERGRERVGERYNEIEIHKKETDEIL
jgi:hypothetical protein